MEARRSIMKQWVSMWQTEIRQYLLNECHSARKCMGAHSCLHWCLAVFARRSDCMLIVFVLCGFIGFYFFIKICCVTVQVKWHKNPHNFSAKNTKTRMNLLNICSRYVWLISSTSRLLLNPAVCFFARHKQRQPYYDSDWICLLVKKITKWINWVLIWYAQVCLQARASQPAFDL